jgi:uncharacterized protein (DUF302 family)
LSSCSNDLILKSKGSSPQSHLSKTARFAALKGGSKPCHHSSRKKSGYSTHHPLITFKEENQMFKKFCFFAVALLVLVSMANAQESQPVMVKSKNSFEETVSKLKTSIKEKRLAIIFEANHKNMLAMIGAESKKSLVIGFAKPEMGKMVLSVEPRAAIEMPLRMAVRELDNGDILVIYYTPSYLFSHYKNEKLIMFAKKQADKIIASIAKAATG